MTDSSTFISLRDKLDIFEGNLVYLQSEILAIKAEYEYFKIEKSPNFKERINQIRDEIELKYGINIYSKSRKTENVAFRSCLMCLLISNYKGLTLSECGRIFGGRDHSTVIHAVNKTKEYLSVKDEQYIDAFTKVNVIFNQIMKQYENRRLTTGSN